MPGPAAMTSTFVIEPTSSNFIPLHTQKGLVRVRRSHKLPPPEGCKILRPEFEPLAVLAPAAKASVPVLFDSGGIIGLDRVDNLGRPGKLDGELAFASPNRVRSTDLVEPTCPHQIDVA